ncbi:MFS transporter [Pseudalkalibacillus berkeleyi]|uniref:MFS transporter n=1 Tax=Pseudalkalibacillus berkeleyi TaxID=1069813 RepID=A0ABS9H1R3_9BACL|nr:MFS transporter [Pseudalkalibacillus berkeleyi]MCF6137765.1 MFS transporter [Pseudalkalibacillus berkeleyi]
MYRERNFLILWLGQLVSILGGRFSDLVIPWVVLQVTDSPMKAAVVAISTQIAPLLFSIPAGVWIENRPKKRIAIAAELIRTTTMTLLVVVILFDHFNILVICSILFVTSIAGLFFRISLNSLLPGITGRKRLVEAHNYLEAADAVSTLIGPILAGFLLSAIGVAATLGIDAFTFLLSFFSICLLKIGEKSFSRSKEHRIDKKQSLREGLDGVKLLFSSKIQRFISFNHSVLNFSTHAVTLLVVITANQELGLSAIQTGILLSGAGIGNLIAIFVMAHLKDVHWNKLYGSIMLCSGIGVLLIAISSNIWGAFVGMLLFDGALSMAFVVNGAARQTVTTDHFLARISSGGILLTGIVVILANGYAGLISEWFNPFLGLLFCSGLLLINSGISFAQLHLKRSIASLSFYE